jgi:hypothetical protein
MPHDPWSFVRDTLRIAIACTWSCGNNYELPKCETNNDCDPGHACVSRICSSSCSLDLCQEFYGVRADCVGGSYGSCESSVPCSMKLECGDPADVCEVARDACFPEDGSCQTASDCPFWGFEPGNVERLCENQICRIRPRSLRSIPGLLGDASISVEKPEAAQVFPNSSEVQFAWQTMAATSSALVLDGLPVTAADIADRAIWGVVQKTNMTTAVWNDGAAIVNGKWQGYNLPAPTGKVLYFLVLGLQDGVLRDHSDAVPFAIENGLPQEGAPCEMSESGSNPCEHPTVLLSCIDGLCRHVCSSDDDCVSDLAATICGLPIAETNYLRLCGLP